MGCACLNQTPDPVPQNERQQNDVLVLAHWGGNRTWGGKATDRRYPRSGNDMLLWVDPRDHKAQPKKLPLADPTTLEKFLNVL